MTNSLAKLSASLPASTIDTRSLASRYKSTSFVRRLQLVTKGKLVDQGVVNPGNWAVPGDESAEVLGPEVDVLVLDVRDKALDTNESPPVQSFDPTSDLYKRIESDANQKDSGCMYGPSFLVYERTKQEFFEVFFGNASGRAEASNLIAFLPVSEETAKAYGAGYKAQPPQTATLKAKFIKRPRYSWHAPKVTKCSTPFDNLPPNEEILEQIQKFRNPKVEDAPEVDDKKSTRDR